MPAIDTPLCDCRYVSDEVVTGFGRLGAWFASEDVSKTHEFCIQNEELCIINEEFCI